MMEPNLAERDPRAFDALLAAALRWQEPAESAEMADLPPLPEGERSAPRFSPKASPVGPYQNQGKLDWQELAQRSDAELAEFDIAEVNLACAQGLPGAQDLDADGCRQTINTINAWTEQARRHVEALAPHFWQNPTAYGDSWALFRVVDMVTVLQRDLGIRYDPALVERDDFFTDARNLFIHGVVQSRKGTGSSLPPLYVAIGRRLGYPLKLVKTKYHLFARWDDPAGERFNIECTSLELNSYPDDYYLHWPAEAAPDEVAPFGFLKSYTPREELAGFLATRGHCWLENERHRQAVEAYAWACELVPDNQLNVCSVDAAMKRWWAKLKRLAGNHFPPMTISFPPRLFRNVSRDLEREMVRRATMEELLEEPAFEMKWWGPMRRQPGCWPSDFPRHITVRYPLQPGSPISVTFHRHPQSLARQNS
jgi:Transglutaminase-like superfamily